MGMGFRSPWKILCSGFWLSADQPSKGYLVILHETWATGHLEVWTGGGKFHFFLVIILKCAGKKFNIATNTSLLSLNAPPISSPALSLPALWCPGRLALSTLKRDCISSQSSVLFLVKHMPLQKQFQAHRILELGRVPWTHGGEWVGNQSWLNACGVPGTGSAYQVYLIYLSATIVTPSCQRNQGACRKVKWLPQDHATSVSQQQVWL